MRLRVRILISLSLCWTSPLYLATSPGSDMGSEPCMLSSLMVDGEDPCDPCWRIFCCNVKFNMFANFLQWQQQWKGKYTVQYQTKKITFMILKQWCIFRMSAPIWMTASDSESSKYLWTALLHLIWMKIKQFSKLQCDQLNILIYQCKFL